MFTEKLFDFCQHLFPSLPYDVTESARKAIKEFQERQEKQSLTMQLLPEGLAQGDVFDKMPFLYMDNEGGVRKEKFNGMLLTNTCDNIHNDYLLFAALRPLSDFKSNHDTIKAVKDNICFDFMYIDSMQTMDYYVDFTTITTYSRELIQQGIEKGKITRVCSLSQVGYYFFICKLTIFLMRWEDRTFNAQRV